MKVLQRNLPLSTTYKVVDFKYIPLIDGQGACCENCGRPIANLVEISNGAGEKFTVGADCAETLVKNDPAMFFEVSPAFQEGKAMRAKILRAAKPQKFESDNLKKAYIYQGGETKFLVLQVEKGASSMTKINFPAVTMEYIKDLLRQQ